MASDLDPTSEPDPGLGTGRAQDGPLRQPGIMQFAGWGMTLAVCVAGGMTGGWFADQALGTLPLFLFLGLIAGVVVGAWLTVSDYRKFS